MPSSYEAYYITNNQQWSDLYTFSLPPATYSAKYVYNYILSGELPNNQVNTGTVTILADNSFTLYDIHNIPVTDPEVGMYIIVSSRTYDFDDAQLSTLYNFGIDDRFNFNGNPIGPNLVVPFSGGYLIENGTNATTAPFLTSGGAVSFPFAATGSINGFPITLDLIDPRYCYFINIAGPLGISLFRLDGNLTAVELGYFPADPNFGLYSMTHDPINDRILLSDAPSDRNFWGNLLSPNYDIKIATFSLAPFRSAVILPVSLSYNHLVLGPGLAGKGRWAIDNDNFGNLFMALSSGEIYKINTNVSPTVNTCIAKGFIEPWSVFVMNKNSLNPHILVANTRGGSVDIIYPNGTVSTVIGETNLLWTDTISTQQKTIADGDIATAKFGCPTRLTLLPDNSFLIGDETGLAIRRLTSPKLASLISSSSINPGYLLNIPPGSILNSIGFSANQYNITTSMIGSPVSQPFFNVVPNNIDYFSIYIENVGGVPEEPYHITYKIPADGYFWTKNKKHTQSVKNQNISSLRYLNIQILDSRGNILTGPDWSFSLKLIKGGIVE